MLKKNCKTFIVEDEKDAANEYRLIGEAAMMLALSQVIIIEKKYETEDPNEK